MDPQKREDFLKLLFFIFHVRFDEFVAVNQGDKFNSHRRCQLNHIVDELILAVCFHDGNSPIAFSRSMRWENVSGILFRGFLAFFEIRSPFFNSFIHVAIRNIPIL